MTIRSYTVHLSLPTDGPFVKSKREKLKARSLKEARIKAKELAEGEQAEVLAVASAALIAKIRKTMYAGYRNINPHLRPSFELKRRHKGRPIKGRRNVPYPKRMISIRITTLF